MWTGGVNVSRNYTVNGLNQYLSAGPASFGYDANGNLTSDGASAYVYDAENRLVSSSASGGTTLSYDPLGRLWKIWSQQTGTTSFVYEGDHVSAEYDWSGNMLRRYFWGPGADEPIIQDEGGALNCGGTRFLHANHQGSIIAASNCDGNLTSINRYDEYGIPQGNWGRFQYTGQAWLPELGVYYYKARIYSATLGRFLQTDPIGYDDQVNLYAYMGNDPVNNIDPDGKRIVYVGSANQKVELRRAMQNAIARSRVLQDRFSSLEKSPRNHYIQFSASLPQSYDGLIIADTSGPGIHAGSFGIQYGSRNYFAQKYDPTVIGQSFNRNAGPEGENLEEQIAHEILGRAYEIDKGILDTTWENSVRRSERNAMDMQNLYNLENNPTKRQCYGKVDLATGGKCAS